ncbi:UDP-N-acetylmuramoyl-L-alanine--D-glutamate ligase [Priestia taiwanensis]|uniref:UDP-N-acetylmuramoylalanine--D-glutamate ligase n=1 Tax=Priestia taiwanensis TaxID=1347902 RepID=A0A917APR4_9BACI|nr:UDP-N-acetylmuramoyl-L-alanine--D-glutamate ligase [Priestia taiwanensis]MBM7362936.1 UDP-N-acetylmuramoylalanine--D-glutamate ligase [Priestia taiwanensis]GGE66293.1 UDP-N-acetylmuramoylalanine--D-glutamate ligase [Priestia taiwanensis]
MKRIEDYTNKQVLVLGLAKSGYGASTVLHELGAIVTVNDKQSLEGNELAEQLKEKGITIISGHHPIEILDEGIELVVKNPGIPYSNPMLVAAAERNIPIITEVELAYRISEAPMIGITGSNGKTTTTTLVFNMLEEAKKKPLIAGNIGTVACEVACDAKEDNVIVTELSSFQLMGAQMFQPKISILLNIFEAHLDYHGSLDEYAAAKGNVFRQQLADDFAVYNIDDERVAMLAKNSNATLVPFSTQRVVEDGAYIYEGALYFKEEKVIAIADIVLPGKHNLQNILAAICTVKLMGVDNEAIARILTTFAGVKHRTQYVTTIQGRKFYNDSKATNTLATQAALSAFAQPVILLAGGLDRGNGFDDLLPYLSGVKGMITYGQTASKLEALGSAAGIQHVQVVDTVETAVEAAYQLSADGDVILLSPACASWDQFKTFEERGDMFIQAVHKLV